MPTNGLFVALLIAAVVVAAYQGFVTMRLLAYSGYSLSQKIVQTVLIWVIPLFAACLIHFMIRTTEKPIAVADHDFVPQEQQYYD